MFDGLFGSIPFEQNRLQNELYRQQYVSSTTSTNIGNLIADIGRQNFAQALLPQKSPSSLSIREQLQEETDEWLKDAI